MSDIGCIPKTYHLNKEMLSLLYHEQHTSNKSDWDISKDTRMGKRIFLCLSKLLGPRKYLR